MRQLIKISCAFLLTFSMMGSSLAGKADELLPVVKEILKNLNTAGKTIDPSIFPTPHIVGSVVKKSGDDEVKVSGSLNMGPAPVGNTEFSVKAGDKFITVEGRFKDFKFLEFARQAKCNVNIGGNNYKLKYDQSLKTFTEFELTMKNVSVNCLDIITFRQPELTLSSKLKPAGAGKYNVQIDLSGKDLFLEMKTVRSETIRSEYVIYTLTYGPIDLNEREKKIGVSYKQYWPAKFPLMSILTDIFLIRTNPEAYISSFEKLKTLKLDASAKNYTSNQKDIIIHDIKSQTFIFDAANLRMYTDAINKSIVKFKEAGAVLRLPNDLKLDFKMDGDITPKTLAGLMRQSLQRPLSYADYVLLASRITGYKMILNMANKTGGLSFDGTVTGAFPAANVSVSVKMKKPDDFYKSIVNIQSGAPQEVKACATSISNLIAALEPLAKKNSATTADTWMFKIEGPMLPPNLIKINGVDPATLQFPEAIEVIGKCNNISAYLLPTMLELSR